ncbi:MAG: chorismate mutase, partial [Pseudomonadota bacterium]
TTNPFAVEELAQALKGVDIPVLIKNPIIPDIYLWTGAIERLMKVGLTKLAAIHRGFFQESPSEYRYPPLWRIPLHLKKLYPGIPLWCDPSHISGNKLLIPDLCQKAIDLLFTGLMIECHISPNEALSDSEQQLSPAELSVLLGQLEWKKESLALHSLELNELRDKIDLYDEEIINILSLRMQTAQQIGAVKRKAGISLLQPGRWSQLLESRLAQGQIKGLSNQFIEELWDIIHEESLRRQGQELAPEIKTIDFLEDGPTLQH